MASSKDLRAAGSRPVAGSSSISTSGSIASVIARWRPALAVRQVPGLGARVDREVVDHSDEDFLIPVIVESALKARTRRGHPAVNRMAFGHVTDAGAGFGREPNAVVAEDGGRAARWLQEAQDHSDGCGLAGAITADECEDAAARHAEGDAVDRVSSPEVARSPRASITESHGSGGLV